MKKASVVNFRGVLFAFESSFFVSSRMNVILILRNTNSDKTCACG